MGLKQSISKWLGVQPHAAQPDSDDFWYQSAMQTSQAGIVVTPDVALKASAVFACVKVIAETVASLPLAMHRENSSGGKVPAPDHPLDELIRFQPNNIQTAIEFWEGLLLCAALRGTGYAEIIPGRRGAVDQLKPLLTEHVSPEKLMDGSLRFRITDMRGGSRVLLQEEVLRIPGLSTNGVTGLNAVELAADEIGLGMAADAYASRVFSNKLNIGGFLIHPGKISPEAVKGLTQRLTEKFAGIGNAHRPMILQEGFKFEPATMDAKDAQLTEARKWQITMIAMRWRIPLFMLGIEQKDSSSEQLALDFVKYTVRPWVRRIEQAIRRDLIVQKNRYVAKFNIDALLRGDSTTRADYFSKALGSGGSPAWLTQNEVRILDGFNPIKDKRADTLGVGTNPRTDEPAKMTAERIEAPATDTPKIEPPKPDPYTRRAEQLAGKEIKAVRKASMRFADDRDALETWVKSFYGGHVSCVMEVLEIEKHPARAYCEFQRDKLLSAEDFEAVLVKWEKELAAEISEILNRYLDGDEND